MQWKTYQALALSALVFVATTLGIGATVHAQDEIAWVKDFKAARAQSKAKKKPIFVAWKKAGATPRRLSAEAIARLRDFVCVKLDWERDETTIKKFRIDIHEPDSNTARWRVGKGDGTPGYGYLFTSAKPSKIAVPKQAVPKGAYTGNVQGRIYRDPGDGVLVRMMDGVLKANGSLKVKARKQGKARPFRLPRPNKAHPPHTKSWRKCSICKPALKKAMEYLKEKPVRAHWYDQWLGTFFCGFTYMMEGKSKKELKWCVNETRKFMLSTSNVGGMVGYRNWMVSMSALLISEYSLRNGLSSENKAALEWAHQYAIEEIDNTGGWFHHPKHGYNNYAADISMIGCMFYSLFLEMEALGIECEPGLTLAERYVRHMANNRQSIGYASNNRGDGAGNIGKNGLVLMGLYATGNESDPLTHTLGQFLTDHPEGPPHGHASSFHHFFGAAVGLHLMGPKHYANYSGMWLHRLIECQHEDGSIGRFMHDVRGGKVDESFDKLKAAKDHDWICTGILAGMILMTEPGVFALSQNKLHIHGGFPDIEGIEPAELSAAMMSIYRSIKDHDYKRVVAALKRMAWRNDSKEATQAASMLYYVMAIARKELAKSSDALDDGDFVLAKTLFDASKANFGMTETHKEFFAWLREETSKEENASRLQRGRRFYSLMKAHEKDPKRAEYSLKAFVAADVDGYYSKKAVLKKIRDQVLAELRNRK